MQAWLDYFQRNLQHRSSIPWDQPITVEAHLREPLIGSLKKFQLGESGEGRTLRAHARATGDPIYAAAIELFIREEQEHARLMARILEQLRAPLLRRDWTNGCFVWMRRGFGLHQELLILLLPEMIAKRYFLALRDGTRDPVLRAVFQQIARDEEGHLAFHTEYLRRAFKRLSFTRKIATLILWRILYRMTCLVVLFDHGAVLRAANVGSGSFWHDCGTVFDEVAAGIFSPEQVLAPVRREFPT
jgi:bacterioferritin (cytochrome b1)